MRVVKTLQVSAEALFGVIAASAAADAEAAGVKSAAEKLREGYRYKKQVPNRRRGTDTAHVTIERFERARAYRSRLESPQGTYVFSYELVPQGAGEVEVTYEEEVGQAAGYTGVDGWFGRKLYDRKAKKRALQMLSAMEGYVAEQG